MGKTTKGGRQEKAAQVSDKARGGSSKATKPARGEASSTLKCKRCLCLSTVKEWFQVDNSSTPPAPRGPSCKDCGTLHHVAFGHMSFDEFASRCYSDPKVKHAAATAEDTMRGKAPSWLTSILKSYTRESLELSQPLLLLSESELCKRLNMPRLPKHLRSVPTVQVPLSSAIIHERGLEAGATETMFCFASAEGGHRQARLITETGFILRSRTLSQELYEGQAMHALGKATATQQSDAGLESLRSQGKKLLALSEFLEARGVKRKAEQKKPRTPLRKGAAKSEALGSSEESDSQVQEGEQSQDSGGEETQKVADSSGQEGWGDDDDEKKKVGGAPSPAAPKAAASETPPSAMKRAGSCRSMGGASGAMALASCESIEAGDEADDGDNDQGEALVKSKKRKLPLDTIQLGEVRGGWGRSVRGAQQAVKKLSQSDDTKAAANDLQCHLDLVDYAKMLWPNSIATLTDDRVSAIVGAFRKAGVPFASQTQFSLVQRAALKVLDGLAQKPCEATVQELVGVLYPTGQDVEPFDPLKPRMRSVTGLKEHLRWEKAATMVCKRLLVPKLAQGALQQGLVCFCASSLVEELEKVDLLSLGEKAADCLTEWLDACRALVAITGSVSQYVQYHEELNAWMACPPSDLGCGSALKQALLGTQHYASIIETRQKQEAVLLRALPLLQEAQLFLQGAEEDGAKCSALVEAAKLLIQFQEHLEGSCFVDIKGLMQQQCEHLCKAAEGSIDGEVSPEGKAGSSVVHQVSNAFQEVSLALPAAGWIADMQARLAEVLKQESSLKFNVRFLDVSQQLSKAMCKQGAQPPEDMVATLSKLLSEAKPKVHFSTAACGQAIKDCLLAFYCFMEQRGHKAWLRCAQVVEELAAFAAQEAEVFHVNCWVLCCELDKQIVVVNGFGAELKQQGEWMDQVAQLLRIQQALQTSMKWEGGKEHDNESGDQTESDDPAEALKRVAAQRLAEAQEALNTIKAKAQACFMRDLDHTQKQAEALAKGNPNGEESWLSGKNLEDWVSLEELIEQAKDSLFCLKPGDFKTVLGEGDALFQQLEKLDGLFGAGTVECSAARAALQKAAVTRTTGKLLRWLHKGGDKADALRANCRAELLELRKRFSDDFDYKEQLPKALATELGRVLAGKRK